MAKDDTYIPIEIKAIRGSDIRHDNVGQDKYLDVLMKMIDLERIVNDLMEWVEDLKIRHGNVCLNHRLKDY